MEGEKRSQLDHYPNEYPRTNRNCFDCLNFRIKLRVGEGKEILYTEKAYAFCRENFIVRTASSSKNTNEVEVKEPKYPIEPIIWRKMKKGWRHHEWNMAGVCPHFNDMREDDDKQENPEPDRLHGADGKDLSGLMPEMDDRGGKVRPTQSGDEILQDGPSETIALPEIKAA